MPWKKLDNNKYNVNVLLVHGDQHKFEKNYFIWLFCKKLLINNLKAQILIDNLAGNNTMDNPFVIAVIRKSWPMNLQSQLQEKGWALRENEYAPQFSHGR